jgi:cephalosporin hydroxylase
MKITLDTEQKTLEILDGAQKRALSLYSPEAFEALSRQWLRVGWSLKYTYGFTWLGRPVIQLPEDMIRIQEVIWRLRPDVIIETGVAHGGSLVYYASLCQLMERGRVIGIDLEIRPHNRKAIEAHPLSPRMTLIEGDSTAPDVVARARAMLNPGDRVLVILDSCHTKQHVLKELESYHEFVTPGSYIVATDGLMCDLADVPRGSPEWASDNPKAAAEEFARRHSEFNIEPPAQPFNESPLSRPVTHWPGAWLRRASENSRSV